MEIIKYLCEFFFGNFWHWLEFCLVLVLLCPWNCITINKPEGKKEDGKEDEE